MKEVYIYKLVDPTTEEVRYIGKTNNKNLKIRFNGHMYQANKNNKLKLYCWIRKLKASGLEPKIELLETANSNNWEDRERYWISYFRDTGNLTNISDGGVSAMKTEWVQERVHKANSYRYKEIHQYTLDGIYIKSYSNCNSITKESNGTINGKRVRACLDRNNISSQGFCWSRTKVEQLYVREKKSSNTTWKPGHTPHNKGTTGVSSETKEKMAQKKRRSVISKETGVVYQSVKEASISENMPYGSLTWQLVNQPDKCKFKYYEE